MINIIKEKRLAEKDFNQVKTFCSVILDFSREIASNPLFQEENLSPEDSQNLSSNLKQHLKGEDSELLLLLQFCAEIANVQNIFKQSSQILSKICVDCFGNLFKKEDKGILPLWEFILGYSHNSAQNQQTYLKFQFVKVVYIQFLTEVQMDKYILDLLQISYDEALMICKRMNQLSFDFSSSIQISKLFMKDEIERMNSSKFDECLNIIDSKILYQTEEKLLANLNSKVEMNLTLLKFILKKNQLAIIKGPPCSGKSFLVNRYLSVNQIEHYINIEVDKSIEVKSLLGDYVISHNSTGQTGLSSSFEWKDGPLVHALKKGLTIVLNNFESASEELKTFVQTFMINKQIQLKNQIIGIKNNFQMILMENVQIKFSTKNKTDSVQRNQLRQELTVNLPAFTSNEVLEIFLIGKKYEFVSNNELLHRLIQKVAKDFFEDIPHKVFYFAKRLEYTFCKFFKNKSSSQFFSGRLKEIVLMDMIEVLFENETTRFFGYLKQEQGILQMFELSLENAEVILQTYSTKLHVTEFSIKSDRFELPIKEKRILPDSSNIEQFIRNYEQNSFLLNSKQNQSFCLTHKYEIYLVVLVGETGAGKTASIQYLAQVMNKDLRIINLSKGSDSADLFGGFKPININGFFNSVFDDFVLLIENTMGSKNNLNFFAWIANLYMKKDYVACSKLILKNLLTIKAQKKEKDNLSSQVMDSLIKKLVWYLENTKQGNSEGLLFEFSKGILWKAFEKGDWILLDEINLAQNEVLERLEQILKEDQIHLLDSNQVRTVKKHPEFRIIGAMNPSFEIGKKPLPAKLQKLFVKVRFAPINSKEEIQKIVERYFAAQPRINSQDISNLSEFFIQLKVRSNK